MMDETKCQLFLVKEENRKATGKELCNAKQHSYLKAAQT